MDYNNQVERLEDTLDYVADKHAKASGRLGKGAILLTTGAMLASLAGGAVGSGDATDIEHVPGEFIVGFEYEVDARVEADGNIVTGLADIDALNEMLQGETYERLAPQSSEYELDNYYLVDVDDSLDLDSLMADFASAEGVESVFHNVIFHAYDEPNDPYFHSEGSWGQNFHDLWGLRDSGYLEAREVTVGDEDIIFAIVDTGIAHDHKDLESRMWRSGDLPGDGVDNDGNGYIDDTFGYNFVDANGNTYDGHGHGTHVAGTVAADTDNGLGVAGINERGQLMAIKVLSDNGGGNLFGIAKGIIYGGRNGAHVMNMSLGGPAGPHQRILDEAIKYVDRKGTIVVVAAGNSNEDARKHTPANNPLVITVAALNPAHGRAAFSNYGVSVDVIAPGQGILSTVGDKHKIPTERYHCLESAGSNYCELAGTSMASPHVAGEVGLILAANNDLIGETEAVREIVQAAVHPLANPDPNKPVGTGRIDFGMAVRAAMDYQP